MKRPIHVIIDYDSFGWFAFYKDVEPPKGNVLDPPEPHFPFGQGQTVQEAMADLAKQSDEIERRF